MSSGLAALVTQAEDGTRPADVPSHHPPERTTRGFCRCLFFQTPQQSKLAAVVPGDANDPPVKGQGTSAGQHATEALSPIQVQSNKEPPQLGPQVGQNIGRKTLVLDLDETLVHSSFRATNHADITITVELEGEHHRVYVRKRPGVDEFLIQAAQMYEVVVYTASMAKYANPLLDELDTKNVVAFRLFREACTRHTSGYMKDLSKLGRDLKQVIIIDNSPICYALQPDNAIPIRTWRDDTTDRELLDLIPILYSLAEVEDIPVVLQQIVWAADDDWGHDGDNRDQNGKSNGRK